MIGKRAGEWAKGGTYWSITSGEFIALPQEGGILPGTNGTRYVRAPLPLVMVVGPLMGLGYIIFLPLIGIAMVALFLVQKVLAMLGVVVQSRRPKGSPELDARAMLSEDARGSAPGGTRQGQGE